MTATATTKNETLGDIQRRAAAAVVSTTTTTLATLNNNYVKKEQKDDKEFDDTSQTPPPPPLSSNDRQALTVNGDSAAPCDNDDDGYDNKVEKVNESSSQGTQLPNGITLEKAVDDETTSPADAVSSSDFSLNPSEVRLHTSSRANNYDNEVKDDNEGESDAGPLSGFVVAVHRKILRMDVYFLSSQKSRPSLFGTPLLLPFYETTSQQDLYASVWTQIARLVSPLPPSEASSPANHAQDCDDSLGYEYPFVLKRVKKDGYTCSACPW